MSLLVEKLNNSNKFKSFLAATGNHFDKKKGNTFKEISKSFKIDYKIPFKDKKGDKINIINQISEAFKIISKIGTSSMGTNGFGKFVVKGLNLEPLPPAKIIACIKYYISLIYNFVTENN